MEAGTILDLIKCIGGPTWRYVDHHRKLGEYMDDLRNKVIDLNNRKEDNQLKKDEALRRRLVVKNEVEKWFADVQGVNTQIEKIEKKFHAGCYLLRGHLGKAVCQMIEEVKEVYQRGCFPDGVAIDGPPAVGVQLPTEKLEGEIDAKKRIWEYLMGDEFGMIGVCGMGGIGKTTIMKHINNQLLQANGLYDHVIWVTVSKELNVKKLQADITNCLKVTLREDELLQRAAILKGILEGKRYVLILDDVWEWFSLLIVGIPQPTSGVARKIVLTSRSVEVCKSMGCTVVKVQELSKEESMNLFLDHVGRNIIQDENIKEIANKIVEQCGGLPLSIVTIATSMKGVDDVYEWRNALTELKKRVKSVKELEIKVFEQLRFSYDRLKDPNIQNCFLYCSLFPEDFVIRKEELIESWIDEGLLYGLETRQAMHERGYSILNKLENNCLLEKGTYGEGVKMHDVLRDMALICIKGRHFMVKAGMQLEEVPEEQEWTPSLEMVSLMENKISYIRPQISPKCPHLSTLILDGCVFYSIPESFFEHMLELKVLDLSGNYKLKELPNSIFNLVNLNSLRLYGCGMLKYVPSLEKLRALKKLDLGCTAIEEVPQGIEKLENLKYLDLRSESLKELPIGILPMIPHIQCLMLPKRKVYVMGEEMGKLRKLEYAICSFGDMLEFEKYAESVQGKWPTNFNFGVGSILYGSDVWKEVVNFTKVEKALWFKRCKMERCDEIMVPHDLHYLSIDGVCDDLKCLTNLLCKFRKATDLKRCRIERCSGIECAVDASSSSCKALQTIEELDLSGLDNLQELVRVRVGVELESTSHAPSPVPVFFSSLRKLDLYKCPRVKKLLPVELLQGLQNLEEINISHCSEMEEIIASEENHKREGTTSILPNLRRLILSCCPRVKMLFPVELLQGLQNLEEIDVWNCSEIEEIIASEENHKGEGTTFILPKLKSLWLEELPILKSICGDGVMIPAFHLESLNIRNCREVKRMPLCLPLDENGQPSPPPSLQYIYVPSGEWWESVEWDEPDAKHLLSPFVKYY